MSRLLRVENLTKRFPGVIANDRLNFEIVHGEIHALLGENGAGKSTLMNMLYGLMPPDDGAIFWKEKRVHLRSPRDALRLGIAMVHQHFMQVGPLTVLENVILGRHRGLFADLKADEQRLRRLAEEFDQPLHLHAPVGSLSVGERQRVEILKALFHDAELLLLDEPTAALTPAEVEKLFAVCRRILTRGKSVVFITHRLDEVETFCDRLTVLRQGRAVGTFPASGCDRREVARLMVGDEVEAARAQERVPTGETVLEVDGLCVNKTEGPPAVRDVSLSVRRGEIVGVAGVDGNGQAELIEAILGLRAAAEGTIRLKGRDLAGLSTAARFRSGLAVIPADRHASAVIENFSLADNALLGMATAAQGGRQGWIHPAEMKRLARRIVAEYGVKAASVESPLRTLSGGHQQRFVLGRTLGQPFDLLIAAQPTRGLDFNSAAFVRSKLAGLRPEGKGVLLVSMDLDEILLLSDRVVVMHGGRIADIYSPPFDRATIGLAMAAGAAARAA